LFSILCVYRRTPPHHTHDMFLSKYGVLTCIIFTHFNTGQRTEAQSPGTSIFFPVIPSYSEISQLQDRRRIEGDVWHRNEKSCKAAGTRWQGNSQKTNSWTREKTSAPHHAHHVRCCCTSHPACIPRQVTIHKFCTCKQRNMRNFLCACS
jgi:hypothetical protein